ncbi:phosphate ABC transporter substrate-binding protein [Alcanivorax sp. 24]|uniref:phosphate ABC transporter substrate-binding protein n=1 Tax=Alcanivorax sp. 24 TaxID=2545266 RepID=UPI001060E99B|nr:phosphate ABC transporter substrate-binding protein [Alcanivorax sp. 24]
MILPLRLGAVLGAVILAVGGCVGPADKIVITGSSTIAPLMADLAERYEAETGVQVDVQSGGSGRGIQDVRQGLADLGMVSRALKPDESDLTAHVLGRDGVAMIVNTANPISALSDWQIIAIYSGKIDDWAEVGGDAGAITVVHKANGRSTQELFLDYFGLSNDQVRADMVIGENQQGIKAVAGDTKAIGYVSIGTAIYEAESGSPLRLLPLEGIPATLEEVARGRYPLSRELNLVSQGNLSSTVQAFLDFVTDPSMAEVYHDYYFVASKP